MLSRFCRKCVDLCRKKQENPSDFEVAEQYTLHLARDHRPPNYVTPGITPEAIA